MDKNALVDQLISKVRAQGRVAEREMIAAVDAARNGADAQAKREDSRMAIEYGALARGQNRRMEDAKRTLALLDGFRPGPLRSGSPVSLGAIVEMEDEDDGTGRTFFLAPAGAGIELTGPGGDGFLTVVTPSSPVGKAVMGQRVGDSFDVTVGGATRSWEVTWVE